MTKTVSCQLGLLMTAFGAQKILRQKQVLHCEINANVTPPENCFLAVNTIIIPQNLTLRRAELLKNQGRISSATSITIQFSVSIYPEHSIILSSSNALRSRI